jgi:hypothetical protein
MARLTLARKVEDLEEKDVVAAWEGVVPVLGHWNHCRE